MLTQSIALVAEAGAASAAELAQVSAAIQKQITQDFGPLWGVTAVVSPFADLAEVPIGYWPVLLCLRELGEDAGIHCDSSGQPYGLVELSEDWTVTASLLCMEMLVNPHGLRTAPGLSPHPEQGPVQFLVEVGASLGVEGRAYFVDDVAVSDFVSPAYFRALPRSGQPCSFAGSVARAQQVLTRGSLTWYEPVSNAWWQRTHLDRELLDQMLGGPYLTANEPRTRAALAARQAWQALLAWPPSALDSARQRSRAAAHARAERLVGNAYESVRDAEAVLLVHEAAAARSHFVAPPPLKKKDAAAADAGRDTHVSAAQAARDTHVPTSDGARDTHVPAADAARDAHVPAAHDGHKSAAQAASQSPDHVSAAPPVEPTPAIAPAAVASAPDVPRAPRVPSSIAPVAANVMQPASDSSQWGWAAAAVAVFGLIAVAINQARPVQGNTAAQPATASNVAPASAAAATAGGPASLAQPPVAGPNAPSPNVNAEGPPSGAELVAAGAPGPQAALGSNGALMCSGTPVARETPKRARKDAENTRDSDKKAIEQARRSVAVEANRPRVGAAAERDTSKTPLALDSTGGEPVPGVDELLGTRR